jgi:uncharacterized protein
LSGPLSAGARFSGYAAIFDTPDHGGDIVRKGAFARAHQRGVLPLLRQHDSRRRIGSIESLSEDERGLRVAGRLAVGEMLSAGEGLSFGYRVRRAASLPIEGGTYRELIDLDLIEVSVVTNPMQPLARVLEIHQGEDDGL